jgi:hypothetical protein
MALLPPVWVTVVVVWLTRLRKVVVVDMAMGPLAGDHFLWARSDIRWLP